MKIKHGEGCFGAPHILIPKCESLFDIARQYITRPHKMQQGTVFSTEEQTQGRGRQGRTWKSEKGKSLLLVLMLLEKQTLLNRNVSYVKNALLTLQVALSVASTIETLQSSVPALQVKIKWPNDVLAGEQKIAGILIEKCRNWNMAGIGVNIKELSSFPEIKSPKFSPISLETICKGSDIDKTYLILRKHLETQLNSTRKEILQAVNALLWKKGESILFKYGTQIERGRIAGVDSNGFLILEKEGRLVKRRAGEIIC